MGSRKRTSTRIGAASTPMLVAALVVVAALGFSSRCAADPVPEPAPADPAVPTSVLGILGLPDLSPAYGPNILLGQNVVPSAPGVPIPVVAPSLNAFNDPYLLQQNTSPAAPGQGVDAPGLDQLEATSGRLDYLRELYGMYQDGALKGALLGQMPLGELPADPAPPNPASPNPASPATPGGAQG